MKDLFACEVGLSDHTMGIGVAVAGVAVGATVIEKHFTLNRSDGGVDSAFSLEPDEMRNLVIESRRAWQALGQVTYGPLEEEKSSLAYRRSLYIVKDIQANEILTLDNVRAIRPGYGLPPKHQNIVLGRQAKIFLRKGTALHWDMIQ
jgi:N-acetylneuraminate synthase